MPEIPYLLVAEDNDDDFMLVRRAISRLPEPLRLVRAMDGVEALEILRQEPRLPIFALLDIRMPGLSGLQVLERLRSDARLKSIPVTMLSSSDEPGDIEHAYRMGANAYVCKPIDYSDFLAKLDLVLRFWGAARKPADP